MQISIDSNRSLPIFEQIVEQIGADIRRGALPVGMKLPTVRALAQENSLAVGTVRQAYDTLSRRGYIVMHQGRGTFVRPISLGGTPPMTNPESRKQQALVAIDRALGEVLALGIGTREARIFFDLRLRELEEMVPIVKVVVVDCNPEALAEIRGQIAPLPNVEVSDYLLDDVLNKPTLLQPNPDLIVITTTHLSQLTDRFSFDCPLAAIATSLSPDTAAGLARIPSEARVGILCQSVRFGRLINRSTAKYCCHLHRPPRMLLWEDEMADMTRFLAGVDTLILPAAYQSLCPPADLPALEAFMENHPSVIYHFEMDQGSILTLTKQIQQVLSTRVENGE
ncbi:MAG: GntR family transcriptional regulator [Oscillospiraceae bacterium]|nr:GntR family transcriptional regulator [Oscillospiraceae bacterium]